MLSRTGNKRIRLFCAFICLPFLWLSSQNEYSKWYFPIGAGLDFLSSPPSVISNNALNTFQGAASISDPAGNLLFYTDGTIIKNSSHLNMANGIGLTGGGNQGVLIVRQPGSTSLYYVFTIAPGLPNPKYSIVDMSLAAGQGSVIAKNYTFTSMTGYATIAGAYHCNGIDAWIVFHQQFSNTYQSFLLTSAGLNTVAVVSSAGSGGTAGGDFRLAISSSSNKLGARITNLFSVPNYTSVVELLDFNSSTGVISNPIQLFTESGANNVGHTGIEFSPDNSKLYASGDQIIHQWDICAGNQTAIAASHYTLSTPNLSNQYLKLAQNGKIYITTNSSSPASYSLHVINTPNGAGTACNFVAFGQTLGIKQVGISLPNYFTKYKNILTNFTYSVAPVLGCHTMSFTSTFPFVSCAAANFSVISISWNFGDPLSGSSNTSTANNPIHTYPSAGNYTVMQILYYPCGSDTIKQVVSVPPPNVSVVSSPGCSNSSGSATVTAFGGVGPYSYTWIPSMQTSSIATNLATGVYSVTVFDQGLQCAAKTTVAVNNFSLPPITVQPSTFVPLCIGSQTLITLTGVSAGYSWSPTAGLTNMGNGTITVSSNVSQNYTITSVTNSCVNQAILSVLVNPLPVITISADKTVSCANSSVKLTGAGGMKYLWKLPDQSFAFASELNTIVSGSSGIYIYTLEATDANNCSSRAYQTISVQPAPIGYLAGINSTVCAPFCGVYNFVSVPPSSAISSTWSVNGYKSINSAAFCLLFPSYYTLTGFLKNDSTLCENSISSQIIVHPKPVADFTYLPESIAAEIDEPVFTVRGNYSEYWEYEWHFLDGSKITSLKGYNVKYVYEETGIYPVALTVKNTYGCLDTLVKAITVNPPRSLYIPNSFTPNGDNLNDVFTPLINGGDIRRFYFAVYNRWGEKLFETNQREQGWDGSYKGTLSSSDIYIWQLSVTYYDTGEKVYTGHVNLMR